MTKNFISVLLLSFNLCACVGQSVVEGLVPNDDVCLVHSGDGCEQASTERFPPSWVSYLHEYEAAKHHQSKACRTSVVNEKGSLNCNYERTIETDLKVFKSIR